MASISGNVTIAGDPDDWIATAFDADTHAYAGVAVVSAGSYIISGLTAGKAYVVACRPKTGPAWAASRDTSENDYTVPVSPASTPYVFKATTAVPGDTKFANVMLLMHANGSNNSTTITDSSSAARTLTATGNAVISTAQSKFGGSSLYVPNGSSDGVTFADSTGWDLNDFTVEAWVRVAATTGNKVILMLGDYQGSTGAIWYLSSGKIAYYQASSVAESSASMPTDAWAHLAWTRASGTLRMFVGGVKKYENTKSGALSPSTYFKIGNDANFNNAPLNGYIDDLRVSNIARYIADFTPPSAAFFDSGYAKTGSTEPTWTATPGNTTKDGAVTWTSMGRLIQPLMQGPLIAV